MAAHRVASAVRQSSGALRSDVVEPRAFGRHTANRAQGLCQIEQRVRFFQWVERAIQAAQQRSRGGEQAWVVRQPGLDERQRLTAEHLLDQCGLDVHHPILETGLGAGLAIVGFVRVQHDRCARQAVTPATAILKALHPGQGVADGIGVVAVKVVAMAGKKRLETLQPADIGRAMEPVIARQLLGHGDDRLWIDVQHGNPANGSLSSDRIAVCPLENQGQILHCGAHSLQVLFICQDEARS